MLALAIITLQFANEDKWLKANPQWHDRYEIRVGGAHLGMSEAEFETATKKEPILARIEAQFENGHLMHMGIRDFIPKSNIPMPGDLVTDLDPPETVFRRGVVNGMILGPPGTIFFPSRNTIHSLWLSVDDRKNWGATLFEDRQTRYRSNSKEFRGEVKNHRSVPIDVQIELTKPPISVFNLPGESRSDGEVFARTTVRNVKPGQRAKFKLTTDQANSGDLVLARITEK